MSGERGTLVEARSPHESARECLAADCGTCAPNEPRKPAVWREGRHWQAEGPRLAAWFGIAADRWMVGVIWNHEHRSLGFGLGPLYAGIGASHDR